MQVLAAQERIDLALISQLADRDQLTVSQMKKHLEAHARAVERGRDELEPLPAETLPKAALQAYAPLGRSSGHQEVTHGCLEETQGHYRHLRLSAAASYLPELLTQAEANAFSYLAFADLLITHERQQREERRVQTNRRMAGFPSLKCLEEFDYRHQSTIQKRQINALLDFSFIDNRYQAGLFCI